MKASTNWYWQKLGTKEGFIITTRTVVHPCLDVSTIKYVAYIPRRLCNKKQSRKYVKRHTISISDADSDYILCGINCQDQIDYKRKLHNVE